MGISSPCVMCFFKTRLFYKAFKSKGTVCFTACSLNITVSCCRESRHNTKGNKSALFSIEGSCFYSLLESFNICNNMVTRKNYNNSILILLHCSTACSGNCRSSIFSHRFKNDCRLFVTNFTNLLGNHKTMTLSAGNNRTSKFESLKTK